MARRTRLREIRNTGGARGRGIGPGLDWQGAGGYVIVPSPGLLAPVYGWFSQGFDTPDLEEAEALLDELTWAGAYHRRSPVRTSVFWSPGPSAGTVMNGGSGSVLTNSIHPGRTAGVGADCNRSRKGIDAAGSARAKNLRPARGSRAGSVGDATYRTEPDGRTSEAGQDLGGVRTASTGLRAPRVTRRGSWSCKGGRGGEVAFRACYPAPVAWSAEPAVTGAGATNQSSLRPTPRLAGRGETDQNP
jgi:hypothetical protein